MESVTMTRWLHPVSYLLLRMFWIVLNLLAVIRIQHGGSVRAAMGHPEPFKLNYVAIGNEDCEKKNYPAHLYDFHIYTSANSMFFGPHQFDRTTRTKEGPKAFANEYAVTGKDAGKGSLLAALAEGGFLTGLERNSDVVEMASYAPLFVNNNDRRWNPDAIVFNSWQQYGTPSYWIQHFFKQSSGATLLPATLQNSSNLLVASAITWQSSEDDKFYLRIKVVNFGGNALPLSISVNGLASDSINSSGSEKTVLTSANVMDENSFQ